jgi:hypothetical protein
MKTPPERDELLREVLSPDELRAATLERTLSAARRQRQLRHVLRGAGGVAVVAVALALLWPRPVSVSQPEVAVNLPKPSAPIVPGTDIRVINDEELLAMFPDRPVALVGPPANRQFVFLDEQRLTKASVQ